MRKSWSLLLIILPLIISSCSPKSPIIVKKIVLGSKKSDIAPEYTNETPPPITIWVYGTLLLKKSYFYRCFDGKMELKKATDLLKSPKCPGFIAKAIAQQDPCKFPLETFYFFGWTGKLSNNERMIAAEKLYDNLQEVITKYIKQYNSYPVIRIICHSHGGNIALYLAHIHTYKEQPLYIDSLILLACPVQRCTIPYIYHPIFGSLYAFYSSLDMVQVLAPQHPYYRPFSSKKFPPTPAMMQAKIKINGHAIFHTTFSKARFAKTIPILLSTLDTLRDQDDYESFLRHNGDIILSIKHT